MKKSRIILFIFLLIMMITSISTAQQTAQKYIKQINYLLYLPKEYKTDSLKKWPLILFLHGSGEIGNDVNKLKTQGLPRMIDQGIEFPFIVVSPQSQRDWVMEFLYEMVLEVKNKYRVDDERIYLTGLSMGGFGTWSFAEKHPELFAAIAPICGGGDLKDAWKLRNMPIWAFHGAKDPLVPVSISKEIVNAVKEFNPNVNLTIYPDEMHDAWTKTYNNPKLYDWFLKYKKFKYTPVEPDRKLWKDYIGEYKTYRGDTLGVYIENDKLMIRKDENNKFELKAASDSLFYLNENDQMDIRFLSNNKGVVDRINFMGWEREEFIKMKKKRK
jgi:predicted esterase